MSVWSAISSEYVRLRRRDGDQHVAATLRASGDLCCRRDIGGSNGPQAVVGIAGSTFREETCRDEACQCQDGDAKELHIA